MLIIRLQRTGSRNAPDFRLVLAEKHRAASKKVLEVFGEYHPVSKELKLSSEERLQGWLGKGIVLSPTAHNLLVEKKFLQAKKVKAWRPKVKEQAEAPAQTPQKSQTPAEAPAPASPTAPSA
ncbi:MAG TPA: 30S ribosomal protein S16 [Patescibacteria group bacterium]|nr:30S ribosomal protein S16 [Patescibacteria group bacterium]